MARESSMTLLPTRSRTASIFFASGTRAILWNVYVNALRSGISD